MNCNSNTAPLLSESSTVNCNNGCTPKDINIVCKTIVIPNGQQILGIQGENNASKRYFLVPKVNDNGDDLSDKNFSIIIKNSNNISTTINIESLEKLENYIKLELIIDNTITSVSGDLSLQIVAESNDYIWKTYPATFTISSSL